MAAGTTLPKTVGGSAGAMSRLVLRAAPASAAAEQYRVLARRLEPWLRTGTRRVTLTSATVGEGRTTTAANLALALAMGGQRRVALVEGHVRAPGLAALLALEPGPGLADVIEEAVSIEQALVPIVPPAGKGSETLHVLLAGRTLEPHGIFSSPRLGALLEALAERFDAVIIDGPPALPTADLLGLLPATDGLLLVVRARRTRRELVARALESLRGAPLLGAVLNGVEAAAAPSFALHREHDRAIARLRPETALARGAQG